MDYNKLNRQNIAIDRLEFNNYQGLFAHCPGFGKTFEAILTILRLESKVSDVENFSTLIVVSSDLIKDNWNYELSRYEFKSKINVVTINTLLHSESLVVVDFIIIDEIHKFLTEERKNIFDSSRFVSKYKLGLSGSIYSNKISNQICSLWNVKVVDTVTEDEAIEHRWISNFIEYNIKLDLSEEDKIKYERFSEPISKILEQFKGIHKLFINSNTGQNTFNSDYQVISACYRGMSVKMDGFNTKYIPANDIRLAVATKKSWNRDMKLDSELNIMINDNWNPNHLAEICKTFNDFVQRRNLLLIHNTIKLDAVVELFDFIKTTTICFNESTDFADLIVSTLNRKYNRPIAVCYHSNISSRSLIDPETNEPYLYKTGARKGTPKIFGKDYLKKDVIANIKNGNYLFLGVAKAMDEGVNIENIEQVITTGGTTNPITYEQRIARGKRIDIYNPEKLTRIYNLYFDDFINSEGKKIVSRDKSKLKTRQSDRQGIVWVESIQELFDTLNSNFIACV